MEVKKTTKRYGGKKEFFNAEKKIDVFLMFAPTASGDDIAINVFRHDTECTKIAEKLRFEIPNVSGKVTGNNYIVHNIREESKGKRPSEIKTSVGLERGWFCGANGLNLEQGFVLDVSRMKPQNKNTKLPKTTSLNK